MQGPHSENMRGRLHLSEVGVAVERDVQVEIQGMIDSESSEMVSSQFIVSKNILGATGMCTNTNTHMHTICRWLP